jgi:hypothetical protein
MSAIFWLTCYQHDVFAVFYHFHARNYFRFRKEPGLADFPQHPSRRNTVAVVVAEAFAVVVDDVVAVGDVFDADHYLNLSRPF